MDFEKINYLFEQIMLGNASVITSENIRVMNEQALRIYEIEQLNDKEVDCLKKIVMICNVLYNRTDMTVLPVEDGFYDLLLEKYKTYDQNFQVGSAVIDFRNFVENDLDNPRVVAKSPVSFMARTEKDETHQFIFDKIMRKGEPILDQWDFVRPVVSFDNQQISKRTHNTEHNHPSLVGTLDKCKFVLNQDAIDAGVFNDPNVKILEKDFFQKHISDGIIRPDQELEVVVELKYDGISVEADCDNHVISARTRGDTGIGVASDITPILYGYCFKHAKAMIPEKPIGVKFEAIMTKSNLYRFNIARNRSYANCRSAIVGLFGASDAYLFRDYITLIPLAVDRDDVPAIANRLEEIEFLNELYRSHGEPLRYCYFKGTIPELLYLIQAFRDEAAYARDYLDFMYDGIVVSYLDENIRLQLGRKNYINKFSMAVKFDALKKNTIFRGYTFEVGQHGNITPMIHYDPVEFLGGIHNKSTGSSFKRFQSLGLRYGDVLEIEYRNDVMPYVTKLNCEANRNNQNPVVPFIDHCPICGAQIVLTDSNNTAVCPNRDCPGRSTKRMVNMLSKLNIIGFAEASIESLGKNHLYELATMKQEDIIQKLGDADGHKFILELNRLFTEPQKDYIILGSLGFTGIAYRKWESVLQLISLRNIQQCYQSSHDENEFKYLLSRYLKPSVVLDTIVSEWKYFVKDIEFILGNMNLVETIVGMSSNAIQIRFTGFRDKQLTEQLASLGIDADDASVTKNTKILLIPYNGFASSKVSKAQKYGVQIMTKDEFIQNSMNLIGQQL